MKTILRVFLTVILGGTGVHNVAGQGVSMSSAELDQSLNTYMKENTNYEVQIGSVMCEDVSGKRVICSGAIDETVVGIVTNVPFVTLNKPKTGNGSKYVFDARVSEKYGVISKGDYLKSYEGGLFGKCSKEEIPFAYAIALETADGRDMIQVKVIK